MSHFTLLVIDQRFGLSLSDNMDENNQHWSHWRLESRDYPHVKTNIGTRADMFEPGFNLCNADYIEVVMLNGEWIDNLDEDKRKGIQRVIDSLGEYTMLALIDYHP